jgi:hypothetical protein
MERAMNRGWLGWLAPLVLLASAPVEAETYKDEDLGFSVNVSDDWRPIAIAGGEAYIVAKWQSVREYPDKEGWSARLELKAVLFDPKAKKTAEGRKQGDITIITEKNPYKSYEDWIKSDGSGGRYISKKEEIEVNAVPTTWYEVAYEKLTTPRHGLAFVYHAVDIDYCLTTEVLEEHWKKLSPSLLKIMKSFKIFPRKGTVKREETGDDRVTILDDLSKATPEQRYERRQAAFDKQVRLATERLTDGWIVKRSKNYVALSHTDAKYTVQILELAEAVRAWAEENLAFYGNGLPCSEMIRICKDYDEERAINDLSSRSGGGFISWSQREITISRNDFGGWATGNVAYSIFDRWLDDKNPRLAYSKPPWLENGLSEWVRTASLKGGKLVFRTDADLYGTLKQAAKANTLISPREIVQLSFDEMIKRSESGGYISGQAHSPWAQAAGFVRYLLEGPGKSSARTKDLLKRYITELDAFLKQEDEKPSSSGEYQAPKTEEEEEARFKNRENYWKDHQKDLLKGVFDRVFKDWTDADWAALEKSYKAYAN